MKSQWPVLHVLYIFINEKETNYFHNAVLLPSVLHKGFFRVTVTACSSWQKVNMLESCQSGDQLKPWNHLCPRFGFKLCARDKDYFADSSLFEQDYALVSFQQSISFCNLTKKLNLQSSATSSNVLEHLLESVGKVTIALWQFLSSNRRVLAQNYLKQY